jgi:hypothetical protein
MSIRNILLKMAFEGKVSKKSDALKSFHELVAILPDELLSGNPLLIQSIYSNLLPTRQKKSKGALEWLALALPKRGGTRIMLEDIYVGDERIMATDGCLLLTKKKKEGLENGYIDAQGNRIEQNYSYPDTSKILPATDSDDWKSICDANISYGFSGNRTYVKIDDLTIAIEYFDKAMANPNGFTKYLIADKTLCLKNDYQDIAVICQLKI